MRWHINKLILMAATPLLAICVKANAMEMTRYDYQCQPQVCCTGHNCGCLTIQADALFWKALASNLKYVADYEQNSFSQNDQYLLRTKNKCLSYDHDVGFRVGARYLMACSCWSAAFLWTHFDTKAHGKRSPFDNEPYFVGGSTDEKTKYDIKTKWKLDLDYWDLQLARDICVNQCLNVRLSIGIRGLHTMQKYKSFSEFISVGNISDRSVVPARQMITFDKTTHLDIHERHKFVGAGPRIGLDFNSNIWCGFGLYGTAAVSGIVGYSKHDVLNCKLFEEIDFDGVRFIPIPTLAFVEEQVIDDRSQRFQANRAMTDLAIGISWDPNFCCGYCNSITFTFGWEHHAIFGQKHVLFGGDQIIGQPTDFNEDLSFKPSPNAGKCNSTLATYGFVFSARLTF